MAVLSSVNDTAQLNKFFKRRSNNVLCFLLYILILFIFEVAILKIIYNMARSSINLTLEVSGRMMFPLA